MNAKTAGSTTYRQINITILYFTVYLLLLPFIAPVMKKVIPGIWICAFDAIVGEPCPFCGLTRDFNTFFSGRIQNQLNANSMFLFFFVIYELLFRSVYIIQLKRKKINRTYLMADIMTHTVFLLYILQMVISHLSKSKLYDSI